MSLKSKLAVAAASLSLLCNCGAATFSTTAFSDAFVATGTNGNFRANNFGSAGALGLASASLPLGEFQSVIKFSLSAARNSFDAQFGTGLWSIQSVTLQLTSTPHNNAIFNDIAPGQFNVSLMQNNSWVEGTGTGGAPTTDGVSFDLVQNTLINNGSDQALGTFSFSGGTSGANTYTLNLTSSLISDARNGSDLSLRLFAADSVVSYLFASRNASGPPNRPMLTISAVPEPGICGIFIAGLITFSLKRCSRILRHRA